MASRKTSTLIGLLVILALFLPQITTLYTNYLWFDTQGLVSVFTTTLTYQLATFLTAAILAFATLYLTLRWTEKRIKGYKKDYERSPLAVPIIAGVTILTTAAYTTRWDAVLRYANSYSFQATDAVFSNDIAFYVYQLPFYELVVGFAALIAALALITVLALHLIYYERKEPDIDEDIIRSQISTSGVHDYVANLKKHSYSQLLILGALYLLTQAAGYVLARYQLLYSSSGAVYGIGYTQQLIQLPALSILAALTAIGAIALLLNTKKHNDKLVVTVVLALVGASLLAAGAGAVVQGLIVEPDELNKERPYIQQEISATRAGFNLDVISRETLEVNETLTTQQLQRHRPTTDNARLWDDRPLLTTLNQLQIFRSYYTFRNVDVDRYTTENGKELMMLAAREIDLQALPAQSQSWVNRHLVYTHGYGAVMSPASSVTQNNLPELVISDIPPTSTNNITIEQARLYYGENTNEYAIVNTNTRELDYPAGEENTYTHYDAQGGVQLTNGLRQLAYAIQFRAPQILFSGSVTEDSRIQYARSITRRAQKIAPFLQYDQDPYLVVSDGELYWIQDAYTTTNKYPYSKPITFNGQQANYIRNSAKITVNAHTGETTFYTSQPEDPLINTYQRAYPELFEPLENMPQSLREHIRYPQDLFSAQGQRYRDYHMQDPSVFYNKEDSWRIPNEVVRGREQALQPYYQVMQLPGEEQAEFVQVQPFIPGGRENLIGWLAARSDEENYGEIRAYHFSKQELTYGPMQIESRIDQDTTISQQITLWSRSGSGVIRGNLLVIPIDNTILYVEPLFLESTEQGSLPQLMRVIAVHGDTLAMAQTLDDALAAISGEEIPEQAQVITAAPAQQTQLITQIRSRYEQAQQALREGDFAAYAQHIDSLEELLEDTQQEQED